MGVVVVIVVVGLLCGRERARAKEGERERESAGEEVVDVHSLMSFEDLRATINPHSN